MFSILIVDDEKIEIKGIEFLIAKYKLPLKVFSANNGKQGLDIIDKNNIDILLTDVKMPIMDGFGLIEGVREVAPEIEILIFSAYGDFDYAKLAMKYDVKNYILKPVDENEFLEEMNKVISICEGKQSEKREFKIIKGELILGTYKDFWDNSYSLFTVDVNKRYFDKYYDEFVSFLKDLLDIEYYYFSINEFQSLILTKTNNNDINNDISQKIVDYINPKLYIITIVINDNITSKDDIVRVYENMDNILDSKYFVDESIVIKSNGNLIDEKIYNKDELPIIKKIEDYIFKCDYKNIESSIYQLLESVQKNKGYDSLFIKYIFTDIMKKIVSIDSNLDENDLNNLVHSIYNTTNINQLKKYVSDILNEKSQSSAQDSSHVEFTISKIKRLIHNNYNKDISLDWLADKVSLSPNYISILLKNELECSFVKYLTKLRINKAKEYLRDSNLKVKEVAFNVGYRNTSYFGLVFKNNVNLSPEKYRQKYSEQ